ncbi:unnamed protein product [Cuscuta campestris]|uniref:RING-type domain-containing protein n=1 Tax=Cuscuta campestris TaxID=132261 RepID=A0A484NP50_9ASTE|nr:unnamed protein product [Cuscuta campestris]
MSRPLFLCILADIEHEVPWFTQRFDARGRHEFSSVQKCTVALRQMAYETVSDARAISGGFSCTLGDHTFTLPFDPLRLLSSPENAFAYFSAALAGVVGPACAAALAAQMVRFALENVTVGGCVRFGISLSAVLETVHLLEPEAGPRPPRPPAARAAVDALDEWITDYMFRTFGSSWGPAVGPGLSEDEVAALEKQRFAGEEEEAPPCSVCLEEYREGDVITPLSSSCSHYFHNACIAKWLRRKRTCPVCRAPVTGGRQS